MFRVLKAWIPIGLEVLSVLLVTIWFVGLDYTNLIQDKAWGERSQTGYFMASYVSLTFGAYATWSNHSIRILFAMLFFIGWSVASFWCIHITTTEPVKPGIVWIHFLCLVYTSRVFEHMQRKQRATRAIEPQEDEEELDELPT